MNKVYADKSLGYSQDERFEIPEGFDPCAGMNESTDSVSVVTDGGIDDLFEE